MATIQEIIDKNRPVTEIISDLKEKAVYVQPWTGRWGLIHEYDPKRHPVMNKAKYPDKRDNNRQQTEDRNQAA